MKIKIFIYLIIFLKSISLCVISSKIDNNFLKKIDSLIYTNRFETAIKLILTNIEVKEVLENQEILIELYQRMANIYSKLNIPEKSIDYYEKIINLSNIPEEKIINIYEKYAETLLILNEKNKARNILHKLIEYYENKNICNKKLKYLINLRSTYDLENDTITIFSLNDKILKTSLNCNKKEEIFLAYNNYGIDYFKIKNYKNAFFYFKEALNYGEKNKINDSLLFLAKINLSILYYNTGNAEEAIKTLITLHEKYKKTNNYKFLSYIEIVLSNFYLLKKDLHNAVEIGYQSVKNANKSNDVNLKLESYKTFSQILKECNDPEQALDYYKNYLYLKDSLNFIEKTKLKDQERRKYELEKLEKEILYEITEENRIQNELRRLQILTILQRKQKDSIEQLRKLQDLEYQKKIQEFLLTQEKLKKDTLEKQNKYLAIEKRYLEEINKKKEDSLKIQTAEKEKLEAIKKQTEIEKRWAIRMSLLLGFTTIFMIMGLLILRSKNKLLKKQRNEIQEKNYYLEQFNEEINTQKEKLQEKNKAITDSIMYAQKIQSALLSPEENFKNYFSEYFIFFQPRDIVSGDFYWLTKVNEKIIIAVADCTGHGVPGAFMSVLGITALNDIVKNMKDIHSDFILYELRKKIIESLRQKEDESETKDGMDIALCVIDKKQLKLEYSGAYNSLITFQDNNFNILKADRIPIGIYSSEKFNFTRYEIKIKKGDTFYMYTDGFVDQFGGPEGKKFKNNQFYEMLKDIHSLNLKKQLDIISKKFNNWKGYLEQIDDVLVVGFRI